jgi:hypothetical protein
VAASVATCIRCIRRFATWTSEAAERYRSAAGPA